MLLQSAQEPAEGRTKLLGEAWRSLSAACLLQSLAAKSGGAQALAAALLAQVEAAGNLRRKEERVAHHISQVRKACAPPHPPSVCWWPEQRLRCWLLPLPLHERAFRTPSCTFCLYQCQMAILDCNYLPHARSTRLHMLLQAIEWWAGPLPAALYLLAAAHQVAAERASQPLSRAVHTEPQLKATWRHLAVQQ